MSDVSTLDNEKVSDYLNSQLPGLGRITNSQKISAGQSNPTFIVDTESGKYVLRRQPPGQLLKSAHAVDREYRVMHALAGTDVPVPKMLHLCEDTDIIGSKFFLMEFLDGRILWDPALPELDDTGRSSVYDEMNKALAALHSVDIEAVGLSDYGRPGNYYERQINRWTKQYRAAQTENIEAMETLIEWLPSRLPADDGQVSLVHGDYRLDNLMLHPVENKVIAVLDWELSTLGHPFSDVAYQCMQWRLPQGSSALRGLGDLDRNALSIPSEEEYVATYCERRGLSGIPDWNFYLAISYFRLASICQGVYKRGLDGNASDGETSRFLDATRTIAEQSSQVVN